MISKRYTAPVQGMKSKEVPMRSLIVEDDFVSRKILLTYLSSYGKCDVAVDGLEAIEAFRMAWEKSTPYDLICMDIMMPKLNGQEALQKIREIESNMGVSEADAVNAIMTTAIDANKEVVEAYYKGGASAYFVKPIDKEKLTQELRLLRLIHP